MAQVITTTKKLLELCKTGNRMKVVQGGTSAGKTYSVMMVLIDKAQSNKGVGIDVISMTGNHLNDGAVKDFKNIMMDQGYWDDARWNVVAKEYKFETNSTIKFKSVDKLGKAKGPRRDILFLNEANEMAWEIVDQLIARTRQEVWIDYNPSSEFWYHEYIQGNEDMPHDFLIVNYQDNEALDENTIDYIESHKDNKNWWRVYGLGLLGEIEGRIYTGWKKINEVPHEARLIRRGLDFGYSNDPTAGIAVYEYNGGIILDEEVYQTGLSNPALLDMVKAAEAVTDKVLIMGDSAEPKTIDELKLGGLSIMGAVKGQGSLNMGIAVVQDKKITVTQRSTNLWKEYENYLWMSDPKTGKFINTPKGGLDHALDAVRYAIAGYKPKSTAPALKHNFIRKTSPV